MTQGVDSGSPEIATTMPGAEMPGYLRYWQDRVENGIPDADIVFPLLTQLTRLALRGENVQIEHIPGVSQGIAEEPGLQARYWYRALGPRNPLEDAEPDLIDAAHLMLGAATQRYDETSRMWLDGVNALSDYARQASEPVDQRSALLHGLGTIQKLTERRERRNPADAAQYRIQLQMLKTDMAQDLVRLEATGTLAPHRMDVEQYRDFEKRFAQQEVKSLIAFAETLDHGVAEYNFGNLFEWYCVLARRHQAWEREELDTVVVRGATSRENAEWKGEQDSDRPQITSNHDMVVTHATRSGKKTSRLQIKTVADDEQLRYDVPVVDFQKILGTEFTSIDRAVTMLRKNLGHIMREYRESAEA